MGLFSYSYFHGRGELSLLLTVIIPEIMWANGLYGR